MLPLPRAGFATPVVMPYWEGPRRLRPASMRRGGVRRACADDSSSITKPSTGSDQAHPSALTGPPPPGYVCAPAGSGRAGLGPVIGISGGVPEAATSPGGRDLALRIHFGRESSPGGRRRMAVEQGTQVSEAQIAVHWREEDYYHPPAKFIGQAGKRCRSGHPGAVQRSALPRVLQGICGSAHLGCLLAHDAGHQQPAILEVVRRGPPSCLHGHSAAPARVVVTADRLTSADGANVSRS
jgi:hypothetical protein